MTLAQLIPLAIKISIFLIVFALGLKTEKGDAVYLLRRPSLLLRSILSMNIAMVAVAVATSALFDLPFPVEVALIALAVSPVPPILPKKQTKAGGSASYSISLLAAAAMAAIVLAPLAVGLAGAFFGREAGISPAAVAKTVLVTVLVPLGLGIAVRMFAPLLAERAARPVSILATALLVLSVLPVLFVATRAIWELVGNGVAVALAAFTLIGLAIGHLLGGPDPENRTVLALATGTRHPGVAIAIASTNFPDEKAVLAVVLYHLVIGAIVSIPYVRSRRTSNAEITL
ncbi:bile acid:sodium symporter family protein [Aquamicrobium terrae]|uniref:BASS family bile acid:Na+ symporter n=1 Tax=Aquamicrobium terrae TaxID=1324945 RepID=A0ABV2N612_9HYPH